MNLFRFLLMASFVFQLLQASPQEAPEAKAPEKSLWLEVDNLNFFRNNEYFTAWSKGYTLLGFHLTPTLNYKVGNKLTLKGGVHALRFSGKDRFKKVTPFFSLKYNFTPNLSLTMGSYKIKDHHRLVNPLFNEERILERYIENGLRFKYSNATIFATIWLDWDQFIYRNDPFREHFTAGGSFDVQFLQSNSDWQLSMPVQFMARHKGGQIDNSGLPIVTLVNYATGIKPAYRLRESFIDKIGMELLYLGYRDLSNKKTWFFSQGGAFFPKALIKSRQAGLSVGYWKSEGFYSPLGHPLFWNIPGENISDKRKMITNSFNYHQKLMDGLEIEVKWDNYLNISNGNWNYTYALSLSFNENFFLKNWQ